MIRLHRAVQLRTGRRAARVRLRGQLPLAGALLAGLVASSCFNSNQSGTANVAGTGKAVLTLERVEWGRLVDVIDLLGNLVERDAVIRENLGGDGFNYVVGLNPVTGQETLTILQPEGTSGFDFLFDSATVGLSSVATKGLDSPPTFTRLARNGVLRLQFSELLDEASVNKLTVQLLLGDPPASTQEVRYIVKSGVGADGNPKGIVIIDPTISRLDQTTLGLPQNAEGYPPSFDQVRPNLVVRIPTELDPVFGQTQILTNASGNRGLTPTSSDPIQLSPSLKPVVVRALRTGNTLDPFNGFMVDLQRPRLITSQPAAISNVLGVGELRQLTYSIGVPLCREIVPKAGDVFSVATAAGDVLLLVTSVLDPSDPSAYVVSTALVDPATDVPPGDYSGSPLQSVLTTAYGLPDARRQLCWVKFTPQPPVLPGEGVDPYASLSVQFDEAVDISTVRSLDTMAVCSFEIDPNPAGSDPTRQFRGFEGGSPSSETVGDYIDRQIGFSADGSGGRIFFGPIESSADRRTFTITPSAGLTDSNADGSLNLCLALRDGADGILDLAGNALDFAAFVAGNAGQDAVITLVGAPTTWPTDRYFALRANSLDEDNDGLSEWRGQFVPGPGVLKPRDLNRFSKSADPTNPFIGQRIAFGNAILTPLAPAGCVLHTVWRYIDLGFGLLNPTEFNLDVEGMNWSPFGGRVFDDTFDRYSIALAHARRSPDEFISPASGYPVWGTSGLVRNTDFDLNILGHPTYDELIVFDEPNYTINQANVFTSNTGTSMYPWPDFAQTYTWRDTGIPQNFRGGFGGPGVPPAVTGQPSVYSAGQIPSIGMPLLARFRCYPRGEFFGANGFQIQIMVGSSALPAFRVFSSGGRDSGGTWHLVIPDDPSTGGTLPVGGYQTFNGQPTKNHGPELYWQQIDFVLRLSRVFTHWFSLGDAPTSISNVTLEPTAEVQPPGTQVVLEFRGSGDVNRAGANPCGASDPGPLSDVVEPFDDYADFCCGCGEVNSPSGWTTNIQSLRTNGHKFFQIRITFVSNILQNLSPELDAFGFAWNVD